jgi:hypothetical protein
MAKPKFILTTDLVKVEPEPEIPELSVNISNPDRTTDERKNIKKEAINVNISRDLKKRFQMWCLVNEKSMTSAIEEALEEIMKE